VRELCSFLEIAFAEPMLDQTVYNSSFAEKNTVVERGIDTSAIDRWREYLDPLLNRWFVASCRQQFSDFGYGP
jgi:hypothetical protein